MNRKQKKRDREIRKILNHVNAPKTKHHTEAYKAIKKMLRAMDKTEKWIEQAKAEGVDLGTMKLDFQEPNSVKMLMNIPGEENAAVLSEIRGAEYMNEDQAWGKAQRTDGEIKPRYRVERYEVKR